MATTRKKTTETRVKAAVGRERKLALELRALLDSLEHAAIRSALKGDDDEANTATQNSVSDAEQSALTTLNELGYSELESIPKRVTVLNEQLRIAVASGNGKEIARLGEELDRTQKGLPPSKVKVAADVSKQ